MLIKRISYSNLQDEWSPKKHIQKIESPDYEVIKLKKISDINPAYKKIEEESLDGIVKEIEISSIDELGRVIRPKTITTDEEKMKMLKKADYKAQSGDILLPLIEVKNYTPVIVDEDGLIISNNFALIDSTLSKYYLYWALSQEFVKKQIELKSRGSIVRRIKLDDLREIEIPWLNENQRKEKEDEIRLSLSVKSFRELSLERKEQINNIFEAEFNYSQKDVSHDNIQRISSEKFKEQSQWKTELLLRKRLNEIVSSVPGFEIKKLNELVTDIRVGINKYRIKEGETEVCLIQSRDLGVMDYKADLENICMNSKKIKEVKAGDILMRRRGGVGPAVVYKNNQSCTFDDTIVRIRVNEKAIFPEYLAMYLNSNIAKYLLRAYLTKKSTTYIKVSDLKKIEVLVPSIKEQREIILKFEGGDTL